MEGENRITLLGRPEDGGECHLSSALGCSFCSDVIVLHCIFLHLEEYVITMPNMYARGILFGKKMVFELGDQCQASCANTRVQCDLDFKTKVIDLCTYCLLDADNNVSHLRDGSRVSTMPSPATSTAMGRT
jgi:oxysterol-binding protein-related protein 8